MPVWKDKNGQWRYTPGPEVQALGPGVSSAADAQINSRLRRGQAIDATTPVDMNAIGDNLQDRYDPSTRENQRSIVQGMIDEGEGLEQQAEALGLQPVPLGKKDDGALNRVFDVLSRPNYAVANTAAELLGLDKKRSGREKGYTGADDPLEAFWKGLSGQNKTTFTGMYGEQVDPNAPQGSIRSTSGAMGIGLISDIVLDPTTYMGFGTVTKARNLSVGGEKAATVASKADDVARLPQRIDVARKSAAASARGGREYARHFVDSLRQTRPVLDDVAEAGQRLIRVDDPKAAQKILESEPLLMTGKVGTNEAAKVSRAAARDYKTAALAAGEDVTSPAFLQAQKDVGRKAVETARAAARTRIDDANTTLKAMENAATKTAELRFGGRTILRSEKVGGSLQALNRAFEHTKVGNAQNLARRAFIPSAEIGNQKIHNTARVFANRSSARWEEELQLIKKTFDGRVGGFAKTSKGDRRLITRALERGTDKGLPAHLKPHYNFAKTKLDEIASEEVTAGVKAAGDLIPNYVPHYYGARRKVPLSVKGGRFNTLDEALAHGVRPEMDVADLMARRLAESHRMVNNRYLMEHLRSQYGLVVNGKTRQGREMMRWVQEGRMVEGGRIHKTLKGAYFDPDIAHSLKALNEVIERPATAQEFIRVFDKVQGKIKFLMTAPNPGFHVRNLMGDTWVNFLDGVTDVKRYRQARSIQNYLDNPGAVVLSVKGKSYSAEDLWQAYEAYGLKSGYFHADTGVVDEGIGIVGGRASNAIKNASETREDFTRLAHFVDAFEKESKSAKTADEAFEAAAMRVKKFNFDYQDLTYIERNYFRRVIPFYTYMRKNIPLQISMLWAQPGKVSGVDKVTRAIQGALGNPMDPESLPGIDGVVPEWLSSMNPLMLRQSSDEHDAIFWGPDLPFQQPAQFLGDFKDGPVAGLEGLGREILGSSTPVIKAPVETLTGTDLASGAPVSTDWKDLPARLLPVGRVAMGDMDKDALHKQPTYDIGGVDVPENVINWLTGVGVRKVTPARQRGEVMRRQQAIKEMIWEELDRLRLEGATDPKSYEFGTVTNSRGR